MGLRLEYINDYRSFAAQAAHTNAYENRNRRRAYYGQIKLVSIIFGVAAYCAFQAQSFLFFLVIPLFLGWLVTSVRPYSVFEKRAIEASKAIYPNRSHLLEVNEEGLHEQVDSIKSFAPWSSVLGYAYSQGVLLIRLKAGLWAIVPRDGLLPGSDSLDALVEELRRKSVAEETRSQGGR